MPFASIDVTFSPLHRLVYHFSPNTYEKQGYFENDIDHKKAFFTVTFSDQATSVELIYPSEWKNDGNFCSMIMISGGNTNTAIGSFTQTLYNTEFEVERRNFRVPSIPRAGDGIKKWNYELVKVKPI